MSGKVGRPLGKPRSEEPRKKMSDQMRKRWTDPVYRERLAVAPARGPRDRREEPRSAATMKRSARPLAQVLLRKR